MDKIERWGMFELEMEGPSEGNPFVEVKVEAVFRHEKEQVAVEGFYDGNGIYKVRFMPGETGLWEYTVTSNCAGIGSLKGTFECVEAQGHNHGMVKVANQFHFAYADGTPYYPFGTTCYAWIHQPKELREKTLASLAGACYNKIRMCVFPKYYHNNNTEPERYPFEGTAPSQWDFSRFNSAFFAHLEDMILRLSELGIEADLILFHPYDDGHWGFDRMSAEADERYLHYMIARLGAYRNVWWSMANEFDYMKEKTKADWDRNIGIVAKTDPYHHLLSIHQGDELYDHWDPRITHASIQLGTRDETVPAGFGLYKAHRDVYHKPVIYDEVGYEGNLPQRWGRFSAKELVDKFWKAAVAGVYMTHGETFTHPDDIIWWSKGGELKGQSTSRIAFLRKIVEESKVNGLEPIDRWWNLNGSGKNGYYYLFYFGTECPAEWKFELPAFKIGTEIPYGTKFQVDIIDTWNMTVTPAEALYEVTDKSSYCYTCNHHPVVELPGKPYIAIRIRKV